MITVKGLEKRFGSVRAVAQASFEARDGAITGLLGANGAGKTTTLRMVAGVLKPDEGSIRVGGESPADDIEAAQRDLGVLLDHAGIYPRLTARENLRYFGKLRRVPPARLEDRIERILGDFGLAELGDRPSAGFSTGERMKVALGRALVHEPRHLVLDEPTNGLDVPTVRMLRNLLKQLRDSGLCIVFSSHVLGEVEAICDHVAVVSSGRVVAEGSVADLCERAGAGSLEDAFVTLISEEEAVAC
jgi:sodium transport system ATP-binding protein